MAVVALDFFEEQGWTAGGVLAARRRGFADFADPVGDFGDFEDWIDFFANAFQLASLFEDLYEIPQIVMRHACFSLCVFFMVKEMRVR